MASASPDRRSSVAPLEVATADVRTEITLGATFVCQDTVVAVATLAHDTVCTAELGGWIRKREVSTGQVRQQCRLRSSQDPTTICVCGDRLWIGQSEGLITILSSSELQPLADCSLHQQGITTIHRYGDLIFSACADGCFACWDATSFRCTQCTPVRRSGALNFCLPVVQGLLVNTDSNEVALLDWDRFEPMKAYQGHKEDVLSAAVSDGVLWTGGHDNSVRLFDLAEGHELRSLFLHVAPVHAIYRSPSGDRMWTASMDGRVILWDSQTVDAIGELPLSYPKGPTRHFVFCIAPIAAALVWKVWTCATDGVVKCWLSQSDEEPKSSQLMERVHILESEAIALLQRAPFTEEQLSAFMREKGREFDLERSLLFSESHQLTLLREDAEVRFRMAVDEGDEFGDLVAEWGRALGGEIARLKLLEEAHLARLRTSEREAAAQLVVTRHQYESSQAVLHKMHLELEGQRGKLQAEISQLQHRLSLSEDQVLIKSATAERYLAEMDGLRVELDSLNRYVRQSDESRHELKQLKLEVARVKALNSEESQRNADKDRKILSLEGDNVELRTAVANLRRDLRLKNDELSVTEPRAATTSGAPAGGTQALADSVKREAELQSQLENLRREFQESKDQVESLRAESQLKISAAEALHQQLLKAQVVSEESRKSTDLKVLSLQESISAARIQVSELTRAKQAAEETSAVAALEIQQLKDELDRERKRSAESDIVARLRGQLNEALKSHQAKVSQLYDDIGTRDEELLSLRMSTQKLEMKIRSESGIVAEEKRAKSLLEKQLASSQQAVEELQVEMDRRTEQHVEDMNVLRKEATAQAQSLREAKDQARLLRDDLALLQSREALLLDQVARLQAGEGDARATLVDLHELKVKHQALKLENSQLRNELDATAQLFETREKEYSRFQTAAGEAGRAAASRISELESLMRSERLQTTGRVGDQTEEIHKKNELITKLEMELRGANSKICELEVALEKSAVEAGTLLQKTQILESEKFSTHRESTLVQQIEQRTLVTRYESQLETLKQQLVSEREANRLQVTQALSEREVLNHQLARLISEQKSEGDELREKIAKLSAEREELTLTLARQESSERSVISRLNDTLAEKEELETRIAQISEHAESLKLTSTQALDREERIITVTTERDALTREAAELGRSLQKSGDANKALKLEVDRLQELCSKTSVKAMETEQQLSNERELYVQLQQEWNGEVESLRGMLEELQKQVRKLEGEAEAAAVRLRQTEAERSSFQDRLEECYNSLLRANDDLSKSQRENSVQKALIAELHDDLSESRAALAAASGRQDAVSKELSSLYSLLESCRRELLGQKETCTQQEDQIRQLTSQLFEERELLLLERDKASAIVEKLKSESAMMQSERMHLSQEIAMMSHHLVESEAKINAGGGGYVDQRDEALAHATSNVRQLEEEISHLRHKLAVAGDEVRSLKAINSFKDEIITQMGADADRAEYRVFST
jgi:chromosome segregation ATPase